MIFLDESGKRWKRIKLSTVGLVLAAAVPAAALVVGSFVYQPSWGIVPLAQQVTEKVLTAVVKPQITETKPSKVVPSSLKTTTKPLPSRRITSQTTTTTPSSYLAPAPAPTPASSTAPVTTPTTTPSSTQPQSTTPTTPTSSAPAKNDYGQGHKPVK